MKITIKIHPQSDSNIKMPDYEIILEDDSTDNVVHTFRKLDYMFQGPIVCKSVVEHKVIKDR